MRITTLKPETSSEVLWMLFSLMTMDLNLQVKLLGDLPSLNGSDESLLSENGATYLLTTIQTLHVSWIDEFEPCPYAQLLFDLVWSMDWQQSYESFMYGEDWTRLRILSNCVLAEAGLLPWPIFKPINFKELIEIS